MFDQAHTALVGVVLATIAGATSAAAQPLSDEARHFLVYQPAEIHSFAQQSDFTPPLFYLHYSHVARGNKRGGPLYNLVIQVSRDPTPAMAVQHCEDIFKSPGPKGFVRKRLDGYGCAFTQQSTDGFGTVHYRSTWIAKCFYMVSLGETAVDMRLPAQPPIAPLLAGLDAAIASFGSADCPPSAPPAAEASDVNERCPAPRTADALAKIVALDFEETLSFLRRDLGIKSEIERYCFNSAIRKYPGSIDSITPALYDAFQVRATYNAALAARRQWFAEQTDIEERTSRSDEQLWDQIHLGGTGAMAGVVPATLLATALSAYRLALVNTRDLLVVPRFHESLYGRYKGLRGQHDPAEAFDIASQGPAYHLAVQQMTPVAGAQRLSGEERSALIARFWRTRLEARYQIDQLLAQGVPTAKARDALAPARRCIGALRQDVARCVQNIGRPITE